jgi:hypothetical protein
MRFLRYIGSGNPGRGGIVPETVPGRREGDFDIEASAMSIPTATVGIRIRGFSGFMNILKISKSG